MIGDDEIDDRQRNEIKTYHPSPSIKETGRMSYINGHLNFLPAFNLHLVYTYTSTQISRRRFSKYADVYINN